MNFLCDDPGWVTVQSNNSNLDAWYFEDLNEGSIGGDHFLKMNYWDIENKFYQFSDPSRMMKIVYHYEIYKMIMNLKGQIIECGVFKGNSLSEILIF